jgi:hypothetical protein
MAMDPVMPNARQWRPKVRVRARRGLWAFRVPGKVKGCTRSLRARVSKVDERKRVVDGAGETRRARRWSALVLDKIGATRKWMAVQTNDPCMSRIAVLLSEPSVSIN